MKKYVKTVIFVIGLTLPTYCFSQKKMEEEKSKLNFQNIAWLQGTWAGNAFDGFGEEIWSKPSQNGTMVGMFRHFNKEGNVTFYEFAILSENGLRLKHFNPDLTGWEEKDKFIQFDKIMFSKNVVEFEGIKYELKSQDELEITVKLKQGEVTSTEVLRFFKKH